MSPEDDQVGTDGQPHWALTASHDRRRIRRFTEEDAARILRASISNEARDLANDPRLPPATAPMPRDAFGHGLRGTGASATPLKGTHVTASRHVRGTLRGQP